MTDTLTLRQPSQQQEQQKVIATSMMHSCTVCREWERRFALQASELVKLQQQLVDRDQHLARLQQDMEQLNSKYVAAIDRVADIQHEKDLVEHDLEELSCKLFEEANGMVAIEKREKWLLETQLQSVKQQLSDEQAQLSELRQRLLQWDKEGSSRKRRSSKRPSVKHHKSQQKRSLISTTLKEEDEEEDEDQHDEKDDYDDDEDDNDEGDDDEDAIKEGAQGNGDDDDDDDDDDETWADAIDDQQKMDDPQVRAQHDLALLHGLEKKSNRSLSKSASTTAAAIVSSQKKKQQLRSVSMPPPPSGIKRYTVSPTIDQVQLEAFQQFVHSASSVPLKKLYQFAYLKYCQLEDVEPCLRFGPHSRLSVKKMMDYLLQQSCFIEQLALDKEPSSAKDDSDHMTTVIPSSVAQRSMLWDRWQMSKSNSTTTVKGSAKGNIASPASLVTTIGCAACGRSRQKNKDGIDTTTYYQFKMHEHDDWLPMDQYCRDRLVAVCEFFVFIRNIHLRLYSHRSIDDLYSENIRLRLQMFYSRMGALPVILDGIGLTADAIGKACPPLDQDYVSDGSISSHIPSTPK